MIYKTLIFTVLVSSLHSALCYLENDGWVNIELSHALDQANPDKFTFRGNVTISSMNSGMSSSVQEALSEEQLDAFKSIAREKQFYRLKAVVAYPTGAKETFLTSSNACSLLLAKLNDVLWISIDGAGFVTSISDTPSLPTAGECTDINLSTLSEEEFNTDVIIKHTELAPIPDTASFIQKVEREREARERGETRDNRSFFAKYWMYIVPVVLLVFISGATNQEGAK